MTELTEFLTARLDEREALARAAHPGRWHPTHRRKDHGDGSHSEAYGIDSDTPVSMPLTTRGEMWDVETVVWIAEDRDYGYPEPGIDRRENAEFIAANDPTFVLADIAAKRRIIGLHELTVKRVPAPPFDAATGKPNAPEFDVDCAICGWASLEPSSGCETLRLLTPADAHHPDYREEWRP